MTTNEKILELAKAWNCDPATVAYILDHEEMESETLDLEPLEC